MGRFSTRLSAAALAATALVSKVSAVPIVVSPGDASDVIVTYENTVNGTAIPIHNTTMAGNPQIKATKSLPLKFVNNFSGGSLNAYVTGKDVNNQVVMLQPDGTWYHPNANGATSPQPINANVAIPLNGQGSSTSINLPDYVSAARIWFSAGTLQFFTVVDGSGGTAIVEPSAVNPSDPSAGVDWGFVELTNTEQGGLYANISYVDFVGLILGMLMTAGDGSTQEAKGLSSDAVASICQDLRAQASEDGQPWDQMCVTDSSGNPLRVLAPPDYLSSSNGAFSSYWSNYVDQVWDKYSSDTLTIHTQAGAGDVACKVSNGQLQCDGDNRGYDKPSASDIFGCNSGPFGIQGSDNDVHRAVVPRLCAAFNRGTLLVDGGNVQPSLGSSSYYTTTPNNQYSRIVHKYEVDGKGYAFSYDDVNPDGDTNQSGVVADANPQLLQVTIGGPS